jgi:hypothetical protein
MRQSTGQSTFLLLYGFNIFSWTKHVWVSHPPICVFSNLDPRQMFVQPLRHLSCIMICVLLNAKMPLESVRHLLRATHLINERLSGNEVLFDTTIATIFELIQYERLRD